jgi:hypothetical protein
LDNGRAIIIYCRTAMRRSTFLIFSLLSCLVAASQSTLRVFGKISNAKREPLAFVTVQVKELNLGTTTAEDGSYHLELDPGKFDMVISLVGYKAQIIPIIIGKTSVEQNIILEEDPGALQGVTVRSRDKAEEYIRHVIRNKDALTAARGPFSCNVYIKALQEDSAALKRSKKPANDSLIKAMQLNAEMNQMALAEIILRLDHESGKKIREERTGVTKRGNTNSLFFLSTTEADFDFYNNLIQVPTLTQTPFISPFSYSGLMAYRFKTLKSENVNGRKIYTISVKPRQLSNATMEGEVCIIDSIWAIHSLKMRLPKYHLNEYDFFEVRQQHGFIHEQAWMITRQEFVYKAISDKKRSSGRTTVTYKDHELNKQFDKKHFGIELSATTQEAYERDTTFWNTYRAEPLTAKELRFMLYRDSVQRVTTTKAYLDSMDRVTNKITLWNVLLNGQNFNDHEKERKWYVPALPSIYSPFNFGGARLQASAMYIRSFPSKQRMNLYGELSYGFRNKDINGAIRFSHLYDPFRRSFYIMRLEKEFEYIFSGDAWINMVKRSNIYLNQTIGIGHEKELLNGLFLFGELSGAFRKSVSDYKTNDKVDSLFGDVLDDNQAIAFPSYNAIYGKLDLRFTPRQRYIREPREKIILGSSWPTFNVTWRKGVPGIMSSEVDFDYLEFGISQSIKIGILGQSSYTVRSGSFITKTDLRLVDYKFQRRGDPFLFMNPNEAFQSLDSTFPVFKRFYEGHYVHEFNGAIFNKIPFLKKLGLREIAGAGFLIAPERDLRYAEVLTGVERIFKYPFNQLGKFKIGVYVVGSVANQFRNPVQFKIGITTWDRKRGKWL